MATIDGRLMHLDESEKPVCPWCGLTFVAIEFLEKAKAPEPGDSAICYQCASFAVFVGGFKTRRATPQEECMLELNPLAIKTLATLRLRFQECARDHAESVAGDRKDQE